MQISTNPRNARGEAVTKLCLALELYRRTDEGRVRDAKAFLGHFFPQEKGTSTDRLFVHIPKEVRADLLSNWGIRGKKSALRDDDEKVRSTVTDALAAGDIDATVIEEGVTGEILVDWVPLDDWWSFWRGGALPVDATRKALAVARELALFDDRWFLAHLSLPNQKLAGTDVVCAALSKDQAIAWVHTIHVSGNASPAGLVAAIGWETILAKTAPEALLGTLDALARQIGLVPAADDRVRTGPGHERTDQPPREGATAPSADSAAVPPVTPPAAREAPLSQPSRPAAAPTPTAIGSTAEAARPAAAAPAPGATAAPAKAAPTPPRKPSLPPPLPSSPPPKPPLPSSPPKAQAAEAKPAAAPSKAAKPPPVPPAKPSAAPAPPPPLPAAVVGHEPDSIHDRLTVEMSDRVTVEMNERVTVEVTPVSIEPDPFASPPISRPDPRALFGSPSSPAMQGAMPPMRPPAATLSGVGPVVGGVAPPIVESGSSPAILEAKTTEVAVPTFTASHGDPPWAPPRAEPGDMGWDIVYGVQRTMATNHVQPKYNFEGDDEPTSEISLPNDFKPGGA